MSQNSEDEVNVDEIESELDSEMEAEKVQKKGRGRPKKVDSSLTKINNIFKPQTKLPRTPERNSGIPPSQVNKGNLQEKPVQVGEQVREEVVVLIEKITGCEVKIETLVKKRDHISRELEEAREEIKKVREALPRLEIEKTVTSSQREKEHIHGSREALAHREIQTPVSRTPELSRGTQAAATQEHRIDNSKNMEETYNEHEKPAALEECVYI